SYIKLFFGTESVDQFSTGLSKATTYIAVAIVCNFKHTEEFKALEFYKRVDLKCCLICEVCIKPWEEVTHTGVIHTFKYVVVPCAGPVAIEQIVSGAFIGAAVQGSGKA